jgi:serine/threonine protein kinase
VDVWSLGVLVYRCVYNKYPFGDAPDPQDILKRVGGGAKQPKGRYAPPKPFFKSPHTLYGPLINMCLVADPNARATVGQCLAHLGGSPS